MRKQVLNIKNDHSTMEIVYLSKSLDESAGGLLPVMQKLASNLRDYGARVTAIGVDGDNKQEMAPGWDDLEIHTYPYIGPKAIGFSPSLAAELTMRNPSLVHTHGLFYYTSAIATKWGSKTGKPYVITPHGMLDPWALNNSRWKKNIAGALFENRHLRDAYCIHSLSAAETDAIRSYGLRNPVCQIPNGIDLPGIPDAYDPPWDTALIDGKKVLLYLGRLHPKKGLPDLVDAWAKVQKDRGDAQDWVLGIVGWGQGGHDDDLKNLAEELDAQNSIMFLGPKFGKDKAACYQNAAGFILPSFSEGLPMVVLEAWAYGLPVLMTPFCNIPEGFAADAAIEIQPKSGAIEEGLRAFFSMSDQELFQMGQNGLDLVREKYTWGKVTEDLYSVYQWALGGGAPPSCVITD